MGAKELEKSNSKHEQLQQLLEVARSMGEQRTLDDLLHFLLEKGTHALSCQRTTIFLLDHDRGEIWSKVALGEGKIIRFKEGAGIAGTTISNNEIVNIADAYKDKRFNKEIDLATGFRTKAIISIPMRNNRGEVIGCLQAINKIGGDTFTVDDSDFAFAFASQAAVAIESAQLHDENAEIIAKLTKTQQGLKDRIQQIQMIRAVEEAADESESLTGFMEIFSERLCRSLDTSGCSVLVEWDQGKWLYYLRTGEGGYREFTIDATPELPVLFEFSKASKNHKAPEDFDFSALDSYHKVSVVKRASLGFEFQKITQQGESLERRGVLQVFNDSDRDFIRKNNAVLEILSANLKAIVDKKLLKETQEQSNRLATIGELSGTIFHDFKNPMASIRGIAELLELSEGNMPPEKVTKFSMIIQKQVDRCIGMIDELLSFTRGETNLSLAEGSLKNFLTEIEEMLHVETDRADIKLQVDIKDDIKFKFDKDRLMRVIFNLTNNALEILDQGDSITITGWFETAKDRVMVSVEDSGPGVPDHLQKTLFEVFVTHGKKNGTGLGLNIVRQVVRAHGGEIELDASCKTGARFVMSLHPDPSIVS